MNPAEAQTLTGRVVHGRQLGRQLGYPTANLAPAPHLPLPACGVYAAWATLADGRTFPAMVNVGVRPTVGAGQCPTVEAHLIGFHGDLYGQSLQLSFVCRIRDERKMLNLDDLKRQLDKDLDQIRLLFATP